MTGLDESSEYAYRPAREMCRRLLAQIPTHFGRLVYLAGLRDPNSGRYLHQPLTELSGADVANRTLAESHRSVFAEWIAMPLAEQRDDIVEFLRQAPASSSDDFRGIAPSTAHDVERQLYLTDLETLWTILRFETDGAASTPEASPRR